MPVCAARSELRFVSSLLFHGPSPPFRGEREGPAPEAWEGEVDAGKRPGIPHLTPALSAPGGGEGVQSTARALAIAGTSGIAIGQCGMDLDKYSLEMFRKLKFQKNLH